MTSSPPFWYNKSMKRKEFLGIIGGMWLLGFISALEQEKFIEERSSSGERVDLERLRKKEKEGQVSFKEAMFYEVIEEKER